MKKNPRLKMLLPAVACSLSLIGGCSAAPVQSELPVKPAEPKLRAGEISLTGNIVSANAVNKSLQIAAFSFTLASGKTGLIEVAKKKTVNIGGQTILQKRGDQQKGESPTKITLADIQAGAVAVVTGPDSGTGKPLNARLIEILPKPRPQKALTELQQAKAKFQTTLISKTEKGDAVDIPDNKTFALVAYPAAPGEMAAYLSPNPGDGKKHPAVIWITGGDCNSIGDVWSPTSRSNDQTAAAYRKAGIVMMFPSLRGGNENPGRKEGFLGEVDDVLAATEYLAKQDYVDPNRIYLGGHSTGGTLALLIAESTDRFRNVFAFGPVDDVSGYGEDSGFLPIDITDKQEVKLRSPGFWLSSIQSPTWVFEGSKGNIYDLRMMEKKSTNASVHFIEVTGASHFNVLAPTNELIAKKILQDKGRETNIDFFADEVSSNFTKSN